MQLRTGCCAIRFAVTLSQPLFIQRSPKPGSLSTLYRPAPRSRNRRSDAAPPNSPISGTERGAADATPCRVRTGSERAPPKLLCFPPVPPGGRALRRRISPCVKFLSLFCGVFLPVRLARPGGGWTLSARTETCLKKIPSINMRVAHSSKQKCPSFILVRRHAESTRLRHLRRQHRTKHASAGKPRLSLPMSDAPW